MARPLHVLATLFALALIPGEAIAAFPGANGKIAYRGVEQGGAEEDDNYEIEVIDPGGGGRTNLTHNLAHDREPAWSPDGTRIAFVSSSGTDPDVVVMNADGSGQTNLTNNAASDHDPAWSPDGLKIAVATVRDGNYEIYVMNADGSSPTRLTNDPASDAYPAWSPDGTKIAFTSGRDGNLEIYVMNADGTNQTRLTNSPGDDFEPDWSPSGGKLAFTSLRDGDAEVFAMNGDGTGLVPLTVNSDYDAQAAWSPDGGKIVYVHRPQLGDFELFVMNANGGGAAGITSTADVDEMNPDWQPLPCGDTNGNGDGDDDDDALCDDWETSGIDSDFDGTVDLVLADASRDVKDVYLEIDYMASHPPDPGAIFDVVSAFVGAPEPIVLHVDVDESVPETPVIGLNCAGEGDAGFDAIKAASFGTAAQRGAGAAKLVAKRMAYRYAIFGHSQVPAAQGSSGCAERPGNDLVVTLGSFDVVGGHNVGTREQQAATLMHELGHTLGLRHGGGDGDNCKPNYLSVMSYSRQFDTGPVAGRPLDYSRAALDPLDENSLSEPAGIGGPAGSLTAFGPDPPLAVNGDGAIDWNRNGIFMDLAVAADVNFLAGGGCGPAGLTTLASHDDWSTLVYDFRSTAAYADGAHPAGDAEMTYEQMRAMIVASAPAQTTPPPPPCLDTIRPRARVRSLRLTRRALRLRGRASDPGCGSVPYALPGKVARVLVAVGRRSGKRCRYLDRRGRLARKARSCKKPKYVLRAKGTANWQLKLKFRRRLPRGRYVVLARAADSAGNVQRKAASRRKRLR